jgi:hypothetical protein
MGDTVSPTRHRSPLASARRDARLSLAVGTELNVARLWHAVGLLTNRGLRTPLIGVRYERGHHARQFFAQFPVQKGSVQVPSAICLNEVAFGKMGFNEHLLGAVPQGVHRDQRRFDTFGGKNSNNTMRPKQTLQPFAVLDSLKRRRPGLRV